MRGSLAFSRPIHHSFLLSLRFSGTWNRVLLKGIVKLLLNNSRHGCCLGRVVSLVNSGMCKTVRQ